jgi:VWFA-related protein
MARPPAFSSAVVNLKSSWATLMNKWFNKLVSGGASLFAFFAIHVFWHPLGHSQINAQEGNQESVYTLKVYHDLVLVDVTVKDKKGNPIRNLHKTDFTLYEDNVPQKISTFDFEDLAKPSRGQPETAEISPQNIIDLSRMSLDGLSPLALQDRRMIILLVDQSSMPVEDLVQAQKAAREFIDKQFTVSDLVAVVSNSSTLKLLQNFTNDREALKQAVGKLYLGESAGLAEMGTTDPDATGDTIEDTSDTYVADETQFNIFNTDRKLSAIETVGKMFRELPGKKFLVHFSSGISTTGVENQAQLRSTINTLNQSNISLYSVDVRGLVALIPGGDASKGSAAGTANYSGKAFRDQSASLANSQETLVALAHDTGGQALLDNNDLGKVFETVREDSGSYYLLGYSSSNNKRDGRFRQIKLQVNVPSARLKYRQGYFAPKSFAQYTQADKERQLEEAVSTERPFNDIPLLVAANYVRADTNLDFVPVSIKFAASEIPFQQKGKKSKAEFDFIGQVNDSKDKLAGVVRDTIRVDLDPESYRKVAHGGIQYNTGFYLAPGQYAFKFLVRENQTGKLSTFEQHLSVPDFTQSKLAISSIILSSRLEPANPTDRAVRNISRPAGFQERASQDPLVVQQMRIIPNVARVFRPSDTLYIFFQTYMQPPKGQPPAVAASLAFLRDGKLFREAGKVELSEYDEGSKGTTTSNFQVPLNELPVGDYQLQVSLSDPASNEKLVRQVQFVIR